MELETLKSEWHKMENQIKNTQALNAKLIDSLLQGKSMHILEGVKRKNTFFFTVLMVELLALCLIFVINPFGFKAIWQYLPFAILFIIIFMAGISLYHYHHIIISDLGKNSMKVTIQNMLDYYEKNKKYEKWFGVIALTSGLLVPFAFLPNKISNLGWEKALIDLTIMTAVTLIIYFLAFRLNAFKNRDKEKIESTITEWNELKALENEFEI